MKLTSMEDGPVAALPPATPIIETSATPLGRELGDAETIIFHAHGFGALTAVGVLHIRGRLSPELVRQGLDWLQQHHPILNAHIVKRGFRLVNVPPYIYRRPHFKVEGTLPIPLRVVIDPALRAWDRLMQSELRTPMRADRNPRMRVVLVRPSADAETCQLILSIDHTIADAQAAAFAIRQLFEFFADPAAAPPPPNDPKPVPPALETVARPKPDGGRPYRPIIRLPVTRLKGKAYSAVEVRRFNPDETLAIKAALKANRTTLHGTMTAAVLKAYHAKFGMDEMTCLSSVEFRRQVRPPLPLDTFGCYVDLLRTHHQIDQHFWALSRDVAFKLITTMARNQASASVIKRPSWPTYWIEALPTLTNRWRFDGLAMTTAGETGVGRDYGPFVLEDMTAMVSQRVFGAGMFGIAVERLGSLELSLCYGSHCLKESDAAEIADRAANLLRTLPAEAAAMPMAAGA